MQSIGFSQDSGLELFVHREPFIPGWDSRGAITHWSISKDPDHIIHLPHSSKQPFSLSVSLSPYTFPLSLSLLYAATVTLILSLQTHGWVALQGSTFKSQTQTKPFPICNTHRPELSVSVFNAAVKEWSPVWDVVQINR